MTDTPNLDDAINQAMEENHVTEDGSTLKPTQEDETPEVEETEEVSEAEEVDDTAEDKTEEAKEDEQPEEGFIKDSEDGLPEDMVSLKKQWNSAYTKQRQKDREELAQLKKELSELKPKNQEPQLLTENQFAQLAPEDQAQYLTYLGKMDAEREYKEKNQAEWQEQAMSDFIQSDDRLNQDSPTYDKNLSSFVDFGLYEKLQEYVQDKGTEIGFDVKGSTKELIGQFEGYLQEVSKKYLKNQDKLIEKNKSKLKSRGVKPSSSKVKKTGMSIDEAVADAINEFY